MGKINSVFSQCPNVSTENGFLQGKKFLLNKSTRGDRLISVKE
jgi:hypothetical protein